MDALLHVYAGGVACGCAKEVGALVRAPALIPDARLRAEVAGRVAAVEAAAGSSIAADAVIVRFE